MTFTESSPAEPTVPPGPAVLELHSATRGRIVEAPSSWYSRRLKPALDVAFAAGLLVVVSPVMALIAVSIAVSMGRPVLFRQTRVGLHGDEFDVLKFRTMRPDRRAQSLPVVHDRRRTHKSDVDPRHTGLGRFLRRWSLDELPQLLNVVRGEMSIVGPRPELPSIVANYPDELHQRHMVRPGLTGLWQVSARGDGEMHLNGSWDLDYVEKVSMVTDLAILARTPFAITGDRKGA